MRAQDRRDAVKLDQGLEPGAIPIHDASVGHVCDEGCDATEIFHAESGIDRLYRQAGRVRVSIGDAPARCCGAGDEVSGAILDHRNALILAEGGKQIAEPQV